VIAMLMVLASTFLRLLESTPGAVCGYVSVLQKM
jgi:hypothetical protein